VYDYEEDEVERIADVLGPGESRAMFSTTFPGGLRLVVRKASILKLDVDVIVNAANEHMAHGAGVARVGTDF